MSKKHKKHKGSQKSINKISLTNQIIGIFSESPTKLFNYKQIAGQLLIKDTSSKKQINQILLELSIKGTLKEAYRGKYQLKSTAGYVTGTVDLAAGGYGYIVSDKLDEDVFVSQNNLHHALNGDQVKVYLYAKRKGKNLEGEVVEILKRKMSQFVGIVEITRNFAFLVINSKDMPYDLFIPRENLNGAKNGEKAIGKITDWPRNAKNPIGEIIEVLGAPGSHEVEMHAILAEFGLPLTFSNEIEEEANTIKSRIPREEIRKRRDFRGVTTFTIDPTDAKDFDDALSIKSIGENIWEIGIHIADVTHYVKPKTMLDEEAFERGTSVYLVDRVVPMLPEKLSNEICSLRPNEEKLCFSAVFHLNQDAEVLNEWYGKTIIKSNHRFSYEDAQYLIEGKAGVLKDEVLILHRLAQKLREQRFENGAIAFERVEVKFEIDNTGHPVNVYFKENKESNQLIEEFMLLANKKVAELIGKPDEKKPRSTFVYRIHDKPNRDKLDSFAQLARKLGYNINTSSTNKIAHSLNNLLVNIQGKKEQNLLENIALRTMAKAIYSTKNIGHYGLHFEYYTHFTSPIRRYPDMMVHRILEQFLNRETIKERKKLEKKCEHASEMERKAIDAERASIKYKQVEFMMDKIGKQFEGVISGVTEWGLYVELMENGCEGMIPIGELGDDFYIYDEENYCLVGRRYDRKYQLGDNITVEVWRTNLLKRQLDFRLTEEY